MGRRESRAVARAVRPLASHGGATAYHAAWDVLADVVRDRGGADALIVDAPYSGRTHAGHGAAHETATHGFTSDLAYASWGPADVAAFVDAWHPLVGGWFVTITDHVLAAAWSAELEARDRYVFAPLPFVQWRGPRVLGDGPTCSTCWIVVARPRTVQFARWGSLPGSYVTPPGESGAAGVRVTGGKPIWLLERLIEDYTRPGELVVDPCMGAGTALEAAQRTGRRAIGGDALLEHAEIAARRIARPVQQPLFLVGGDR